MSKPDTGNKILASTITSTTRGSNCAAGSGDPPCTTSVPVAVLTITNTANVGTTTPGGVVRFTGTFTNTGQVVYTGITIAGSVTDVRDDASSNGDSTATSGTLSVTNTGLTWTGNIPVGGSVTISGSVTVNTPDTGNKVLVNTLSTAAAGSNCPSGSTDPACSVSVPVLTPALTIVTTANATSAAPGQRVTATVTVTNTGQTPYSGAVVSDSLDGSLDDATYGNDAAATTGSVSYAAPVLTWTGNLAVGASAVITYTLTVKDPDTGDKVIINTATSADAGSACPPGATAAPCRVTVAVLTPGLTIASSASARTTTPGSVVTYTVTVTNSGQTPYTGAAFTDPLSGIIDDAAYNGDASATAGGVSFASPDLTWTGNLAPGASATITFSVTVNSPDTGNKILASTITSATSGSNCPAGSGEPGCTTTVPVAVLTITSVANVGTTTPGGVVRFTGTFTNAGQVAYNGITINGDIADTFDDATPNGDETASSGTLSVTSSGLTWTGSIPVGGSVTVTGTVTVNNPDTGNKLISNVLATTAPGSNCPSGGTDPACSVSVPVLIPALSITQTSNATSAIPGQQVGFTVTITDSGPTAYTGISVTDTLKMLDDADYNGDAAATAGSVSFASPVLTWTGNLSPGDTATVTFTATVHNPDTGDKTLAATAASTAPGSSCPPGSGNAGCNITVPVLTPALTITAAASPATATPGQTVSYTITVTDSGQTPYTGATVTSLLSGITDDAAYNGDAAATTGTVSFASPDLTWTGNLAPGDTATITYTATVDNPDTGDHILTGTLTSTTPGNNCPASSTDPRCTSTVAVAQLVIDSTADVSTTTPGGVVHYTTTLTNTGQTPYHDITLSSDASGLIDNAVGNADQTATSGSFVVGTTGAVWTGDIPVGGTVTLTGSVTVNNPDTGDHVLTEINTSDAPGSNCPDGSTDPRCGTTIDVLTPALTITKTANTTAAVPGATVTYTITVADTGQAPYTGAVVTDSLDSVLGDAAYNNDAAATSGTVSYASPDLTWTGDLAPGDTATITYTVTVHNPDTGGKLMVNFVTSAAPGSNCAAASTDPRCTSTVPVATLTIVNTANVGTTTPGGRIDYTITITNTGQTRYEQATVTDDLSGVTDDSVAFGDHGATTIGSISYVSPNLTWTGDLEPGQFAIVTFSVTVNNPDTGDKTITSTITSTAAGNNCPAGSADARCTSTVTVLIPALTITKTASTTTTTPGSTVTYTVTVTDTGPTPYTGATVTDHLAGVLSDAAYNNDAAATSGTVGFTSPDLTWTGNLAPGDAATITYTVTVDNPDTGDKIMVNSVSSDAMGSTCPPGSDNPACTATVTDLIPALTITKTASTAGATPGSTVGYTITVTDTGQIPYTAATATDDLSGVLGDAAYNNDATATRGAVSFASPNLTWTGDLTPGQAATITYTVTVDNPDTGPGTLSNTVTSAAPGSTCLAASPGPDCAVTVAVVAGPLTITVPATASLGSAPPGGTLGSGLGTVQVTDDRGFGADWTATVASTGFATGTGTQAETIPAADAQYLVTALAEAVGPATFTPVPVTQLSASPQPVVSATNVSGNTTVSWDPTIQVSVPSTAISGDYTATITHSVS